MTGQTSRETHVAPSDTNDSSPIFWSLRRASCILVLAVLALYAVPLAIPVLIQDDFDILHQSWTWQATKANVWLPQNEHIMPIGRWFTFALVRFVPPPWLPRVCVAVGVFAVLVGMGLAGVFVRRELGSPFLGVLAAMLFGVSTVYHQAVTWFAASFSVLALDFTLLALLAAQRWRETGRPLYLDLCALLSLLAPAWFASGILTGPLCCLYLMGWDRGEVTSATATQTSWWQRFGLAPMWGTALFLVASLTIAGQRMMHLEHYGEQTAVEAFQPWGGAVHTFRSVVDNLLLGQLGITTVALPLVVVGLLWVALLVVGVWWWRLCSHRRLFLLGLGMIGSAYLLIYSARATWSYSLMTQPNFSRYHLLPQLGLALIVCAGVPSLQGRWLALRIEGITLEQGRFLCWLTLLLFLIHLPRGILCYFRGDRQAQIRVLEQIETTDAKCRQHRIGAELAREALPKLEFPQWSATRINAWNFLRGSDQPDPTIDEKEARRLLTSPTRRTE